MRWSIEAESWLLALALVDLRAAGSLRTKPVGFILTETVRSISWFEEGMLRPHTRVVCWPRRAIEPFAVLAKPNLLSVVSCL